MKYYFCTFLFFIITPLFANSELARSHFSQGTDAFRKQQYLSARNSFVLAREAGLDSPALQYNLAVSHYRLGELEQAEKEFSALALQKNWKALANYNLGLVAERQGRSESAENHYRVAHQYGDEKIQTLSWRALSRFAESPPQLAHYVYASLSLGQDDNVILQASDPGSDERDQYTDTLLLGRYYLTRAWSLQGLYYQRRYAELDRFNTNLFQAGLFYRSHYQRWRWEAGLSGGRQTLDGETYLDSVDFELQGSRSIQGYGLRLKGEVSRLDAAPAFFYLQGYRARLESRIRRQRNSGYLQADYRLELNDREDLIEAQRRLGFSPTRHRLRLIAQRNMTTAWSARVTAEYEHSHYPEEFLLEGETLMRSDDRLVARLRLGYEFCQALSAFFNVAHSKNHSHIHEYEYRKTDYSLGMEYSLF